LWVAVAWEALCTRGGCGVLGRAVRWELGVRLVALCGAWRQLFGKFGIDKQNVCL
jgi:hypothetical protein